MASLAPIIKQQFLNNSGEPLSGGKLYTYEAGTSTPRVTYKDKDASVPNTNPIILDSRGECDIWFDTGSYKFVLKDSDDSSIWSVDNVKTIASLLNTEGALAVANNLSDVGDAATSRTNLGLGNVDNTSDINKPISSATQSAIDSEALARSTNDDALQANIDSEATARESADTALDSSKVGHSGLTSGHVPVAGPGNTIQTSSVTDAELGYLSGVTSSIQTQLNALGGNLNVVAKTTTYTATTGDNIILCATSSAWTLTLYTAAGNSGKVIRVKKTSSDFNSLTIDANGSETIDGSLTYTLYLQNDEVTLVSDGAGWQIIAEIRARVYATYSRSSTQTLNGGANTIRDYNTLIEQSHSGMVTTGAGWNFTAKRPGQYKVIAMSQPTSLSSGEQQILNFYKNGSFVRSICQHRNNAAGADDIAASGAVGIYLALNDYIDVRHFKSNTTTSTAAQSTNWITIVGI